MYKRAATLIVLATVCVISASVGWSQRRTALAPAEGSGQSEPAPTNVTPELKSSAPVPLEFSGPETQTSALGPFHVLLDEGNKLVNAERLTIKFQGYPDLSGEYRVNPDSTITIPVIGRVPLGDSDPSELERVLSERVSRVAGRVGFVTVEISQYNPVFITGFVSTSGAIAWRPGMTVLHAVSMAGGLYRSDGKGGLLGADLEATRIQRATADLSRVLAHLARLGAEGSDAKEIRIPDRLVELVGLSEAEALIIAQQSSFESRRNAQKAEQETLTRGIVGTEQELLGLKEQRLRVAEQLKLRLELHDKLTELLKSGIVRRDRVMEELAQIANLEEKATNVSVAITRAESSLTQMRRQVAGLRQEHRAALDTEILKQERESAQLEIEIKSAAAAHKKATGALGDANKKLLIEYRITRAGQDASIANKADEFTALRPGDIVVVSAK